MGSADRLAATRPDAARFDHRFSFSFDDLRPFEILQNQYADWGICFHNAIALQPTNASFQTNCMGIMPMGGCMKLTIGFAQPPRQIRLQFTAASAVHATLFDAHRRPILQSLSRSLPLLPASSQPETGEPADAPPFPQYELSFDAIEPSQLQQPSHSSPQIYWIELESAAPFVLQLLVSETDC